MSNRRRIISLTDGLRGKAPLALLPGRGRQANYASGGKLSDCLWARRPLNLPGIVDMHTHMGRWIAFPIRRGDADSMVAQMDRVGIARIVCAHTAALTPDAAYGNDQVLAAMKRHPARISGYAGVYPVSRKLGLDEVKRCIGRGMVGIKLHEANQVPYTSKLYEGIWRYADDRKLPVLLHTWGNLAPLEGIFKTYRRARILLGHAGAANEAAYVKCAAKYENVYLDLAYSASPYGLVEYFVRNVSARKVVFGSDMPWMALTQQIGKVVFADITEAEKKQILVENAARILGI